MPLDGSPRADALARELGGADADAVLRRTLLDPAIGPTALVSSFGAESVVLLHLAASIDRAVPVIFLETGMLFPETLDYQRAAAERLGLTDLRVVRPGDLGADPGGTLHRTDPDACCTLRKSAPLASALAPFGAWITGRKRHHGGGRTALPVVEAADGRIKVNPLARWTPRDVADHMAAHDLPRHPLVARGYASIGCAPCTAPAGPGEAARAGRWRGTEKTECGIHFEGGRAVPGPARRDAA